MEVFRVFVTLVIIVLVLVWFSLKKEYDQLDKNGKMDYFKYKLQLESEMKWTKIGIAIFIILQIIGIMLN